jgi:DNA-binding transcriptional LysR family regulator
MRIDQLLNFKCVADERSYTRAAERCFLTQPAIYSQVRQLESEAGTKLFYVSGKEVLLTAAGRDLYAFAQTVEAGHEDYRGRVRSRELQRARHVRIAALSYFGVMSEATERLRADDSAVVVDFHSRRPAEAMELIRAGEVDFGFFGSAFAAEGLVHEHCADNVIVAVAPAGHPLVGREIDFDELASYTPIGYAAGSARGAIEEWLADHPTKTLRYSAQTDSSLAAKTLAMAMGSPAFIVRQAVAEDIARGAIAELHVRDLSLSYPLFAVYLGEEQLGSSAREYLRVIRDIFQSTR